MRVLRVHNFYQNPGGEDQSFASESALLESHGVTVIRYTLHNDAINQMGRLEVAGRTLWNPASYRDIRALIRREQPDLVHFDNTFPLVSPSAYYAARAEGRPVVQALRNHRLSCLNAYLLREGIECERCIGKLTPWPGVVHACYRNNRAASATVAAMLTIHRLIGTYHRIVDCYIAQSEFNRQKFISAGYPEQKVAVKPNFVARDYGIGDGSGGYALFVGRLSEEKGIHTLLQAWPQLSPRIPLMIIGDGPLNPLVAQLAERYPEQVIMRGWCPPESVIAAMQSARILVFPSLWNEGFGRVVAESYMAGTPVVASAMGSIAEIVQSGETGGLFRPGDPQDLVRQAQKIVTLSEEAYQQLRRNARAYYEKRFTPSANLAMLLRIYQGLLA